ncbi:hypothetical protein Q8W71_09810 [Methylobacterium sp. NEAU 140]|uniref:hypothetical protein n=1 Tax=Methylobacterium sp. NEAU 140 TaxID=3064945 RepID=UPI002736946E|nr:hypothetical protein [Methylobacterium sp. NEAU 140]MDP4022917.1 hypothetical protein [Methylobacterium sp. NEAU 140]
MASVMSAAASEMDLGACKKRFEQFLKANPNSEIQILDDTAHGKTLRLMRPWNDPSLAVVLPQEYSALAQAINNLILPERLSAIYHIDLKKLEFIFSAFPLGNDLVDLSSRTFNFYHRGSDYECGFGTASPRLTMLARYTFPVGQSLTQYRNILSFHIKENKEEKATYQNLGLEFGDSMCFWIKDIDWEEDFILSMVRELNFYMRYFDNISPLIQIHSPKIGNAEFVDRPRFKEILFPKKISSRELDEHLLRFWSASLSGDPANRFLYAYRLIEYAAVLYLERGSKDKIRRIVGSPSALNNIDKLTEDVLLVIQGNTMDAYARLESLIKDVVTEEVIWDELNRNPSAFNQQTSFDGGFTIEPVIKGAKDAKSFGVNGITTLAKRLKDIRNALAHGRDQRSTLPLTPTSNNLERLQPWAAIIQFIAAEVIIYRNQG